MYQNLSIETGECTTCETIYHADHEVYKTPSSNTPQEVFLNNARYLKVGSNLWVDRIFSKGVLSGMYNFHASANAYMQYWNDSFGKTTSPLNLSRKQVWQSFVQESIRTTAEISNIDFEARQNIAIDEVSFFVSFEKKITSLTSLNSW